MLAVGGAGLAVVLTGVILAVTVAAPPPEASPTPTPVATPTRSPSPTPSPTARQTATPTPSPTPSPTPIARCPLDGVALPDDEPAGPALAVQIENHPDARPARNLSRADMIVEATVEGDTTRFTGIFLCDATEGMTGPVRSARYYNIDLWQDIGVLTVGFGASPGALQRFAAAGMPYPNGLDGVWPWYRRFGAHAAPHNLYVDLEGLRDGLTENAGLAALAADVDELRPPFTFAESPPMPGGGRPTGEVQIWTNGYWTFAFTWDADLAAWRRSDAGVAIEDEATGDPVAPTSVVVQRVTQETVFGDPDPGGNPRRLQHLVGSGTGTLYVEGHAYDVRWERPTAADATAWTFADIDEPVVLPPGQVWLELLPVEATLQER
jgi:Protein of unknown function (DUF3048) N-terminal domain/Protein of unknown function (DUF3048) C-terminal domain